MSYSTDFTNKKNIVRLRIGDNNPTEEYLVDDEIAYALSSSSDNILLACSLCCSMIAGKMARLKEKVTEEDLVIVDKRFAYWTLMAETFKKEYDSSPEGKTAALSAVKKSTTIDVSYIRGL